MTRPIFSIIIPCYNYGHLVRRAVLSVVSQPGDDYEVVVINDGSTDDSTEVLVRLAEEYPRKLQVLHQVNCGQSAVRNKGVAVSRGDWLIFLDADDEMAPGALEAYARAAARAPTARLLVGGHFSESGRGRKEEPAYRFGYDSEANFRAYLWKKASLSNGACAIHRSVFQHVRYDEAVRHSEDIAVFAVVLARFHAVGLQLSTAVIHKHPDSMRHDYTAARKVGMSLESVIFDQPGLPSWTQKYRAPYRARRALSLLKLAYTSHEYRDVLRYFRLALSSDWRQALKPGYVRRLLRALAERGFA